MKQAGVERVLQIKWKKIVYHSRRHCEEIWKPRLDEFIALVLSFSVDDLIFLH